jgi:hypothetical protein
MTNLQAVREAVIKAVPSILDLGEGCRFTEYVDEWVILRETPTGFLTFYPEEWKTFLRSREEIELSRLIRIIGRPIRLADVVQAHRWQYSPTTSYTFSLKVAELVNFWDCKQDDLSKQSPETIEFLHQLLITK